VERHNRKKIREIYATHKPDKIWYSHILYACPKCETLHKRFFVSMRKNRKTLYTSNFKCGTCRSRLVAFSSDDTEKYRCGKCGEQALECIDEGLVWD
jgi:hypothetical protein